MIPPGEMHPITISEVRTAVVTCRGGDFMQEATDVAEVQSVLAAAAMHAMATGHIVREHVARDMTIFPEP